VNGLPVTLTIPISSDKTVEITGHMHAFRLVRKHVTVNTCCISRGMGVRKVANSKMRFKVFGVGVT